MPMRAPASVTRCSWARTPLGIAYHDREWGVPVHDDRLLFEFLILEGAQAGLSWETILKKREAYRTAFAGFDPALVARFTPKQVERLLKDPGIVRNRLKITQRSRQRPVVSRCSARVRELRCVRVAVCWRCAPGQPATDARQIPPTTAESDALSRDLLKRGFKFVGSTICYAFMQAVGMVNDHTVDCFRYEAVGARGARGASTGK